MNELEEKAKTRFLELYDGTSSTFGSAARTAQEETGFQLIDPDKRVDYIDTIAWCWAADKDGWKPAGAAGGLLTVCPECHNMCHIKELFIHKQHHELQRLGWC